MPEYSRRLGSAVKKARLELGMTQEQVNKKSNTDISTIINIEMGRGNPKFTTLSAIIGTLKMDAREIFDAKAPNIDFAARRIHLLVDECSRDESAVLLPVIEAILTALRSTRATEIK